MDVVELEDRLSAPSPAAIGALRGIRGDVVVLGAGGKMGPSLARMAARARQAGGAPGRVVAVSRFGDAAVRSYLDDHGVHTITADLLDPRAVDSLPDAAAVFFLAGTKFGTGAAAARTWAHNAVLPGLVAARYRGVPTVVFSSGNVYPFVPVGDGCGAAEDTEPAPVGEYAWSVLARERIFEHFAITAGTPVLLFRLNYAAELRYGVPVDVALKVLAGEPIDLTTGHCNVIWQGDANAMALASLGLAEAPAAVLNVTGPETIAVRDLALRFGERFGKEPRFLGVEAGTALLSDAGRAHRQFGPARVPLDRLVAWIADWVSAGGPTRGAPTHYEVRDGRF